MKYRHDDLLATAQRILREEGREISSTEWNERHIIPGTQAIYYRFSSMREMWAAVQNRTKHAEKAASLLRRGFPPSQVQKRLGRIKQ